MMDSNVVTTPTGQELVCLQYRVSQYAQRQTILSALSGSPHGISFLKTFLVWRGGDSNSLGPGSRVPSSSDPGSLISRIHRTGFS
jgi:hypothetical protein